MKNFLLTCTALMVVAGIYGASDMAVDIKNDDLIEYEHVREHHAKHLLDIIKTTGLPAIRYGGAGTGVEQKKNGTTKLIEKKSTEDKGRTAAEVMEIFSRGDIEETLLSVATVEDEKRAEQEAERHIASVPVQRTREAAGSSVKVLTKK